MSENRKNKIKVFPLKNNFLISKSRNLSISNANEEEIKTRKSSNII